MCFAASSSSSRPKGYSLSMYDSNCMCSFMEIAFGVNMLMSAFQGFRDFGQEMMRKRIVGSQSSWVVAQVAAAGLDEEKKREYSNLHAMVENGVRRCEIAQAWLCRVGRVVAFVFGLACIFSLYLGLEPVFHWWTGMLIAPWPVYFLSSVLTWFGFGLYICVLVKLFKMFKKKFAVVDIPRIPNENEIRDAFGVSGTVDTPKPPDN